jgi:PiT family inorganic phosphate transporter
MVFALLIAAIIWNLGTWALGLPASSARADRLDHRRRPRQPALRRPNSGTSGVDWSKAIEIGQSLLISPVIGFIAAALLSGDEGRGEKPRALCRAQGQQAAAALDPRLLIATCTGVSFAHGSNDGQKGMGLIMLILIGCAPTAYALNRAIPAGDLDTFRKTAIAASAVIDQKALGRHPRRSAPNVTRYVSERTDRRLDLPGALGAEQGDRQADRDLLADCPSSRPRSATPATTCISPPRR